MMDSKGKSRRTRRGGAADAADVKLKGSTLGGGGSIVDKFRNSVADKTARQDKLDMLELTYRKQSEKKKIEVERFKNDIAKLLDDSDDEDIRVTRRNKRNQQQNKIKAPGSLKGKWEQNAQKTQEVEQQKLDRERKRREKQDRAERNKAKKALTAKGEQAEEHSKMTQGKVSRQPSKIKTSFMDIAQQQEEENRRKIQMERMKRIRAEQSKMVEEQSNWELNIGMIEQEEDDKTTADSPTKTPGKLNIDFAQRQLEEQREKEERIMKMRRDRLQRENEHMNDEYSNLQNSTTTDDEGGLTPVSAPKRLEKHSLNFLQELSEIETLEQELAKLADERHGFNRKMDQIDDEVKKMAEVAVSQFPDRNSYDMYLENLAPRIESLMDRKGLLQENVHQITCRERMLMKKIKEAMEREGVGKAKRTSTLGSDKLAFDKIETERRKREEAKIYQERLERLEGERKALATAQKIYRMNHQDDEEEDSPENSRRNSLAPKQLDHKLANFNAMQHQKQLQEKNDLLNARMTALQAEMDRFKELNENEDLSDSENQGATQGMNVERNYAPGRVNTRFDDDARHQFEQERYSLRTEKEKLLEEEIRFMKMQRAADGDTNVADSSNIEPIVQDDILLRRPQKLNRKLFECVDLEAQRMMEQQKIMAERDRKLAEEKAMFQQQRMMQDDDIDEEETYTQPEVPKPKVKGGKKINADSYLMRLQKQQEEAEQARLMEKRFERMTFEQQEMLLAHEKQQQDAQYYFSEEEVDEYQSDDSEVEDACAPIFLEQLPPNQATMEGTPAKFDCTINSQPKPHITWYFNRRPIRDSEDYTYVKKGNQYSLIMNETFLDDSGEYICKAENSKGAVTSVCILHVEEDPDLED